MKSKSIKTAPQNGGFAAVTPSFVLIGIALSIWSIAASLSSYLGQGFAREHHSGAANARGTSASPSSGAMDGTADSAGQSSLEQLRKAVKDAPQNAEAHVALGYALFQEAHESQNSELLMEAVQTLGQAIAIDPNSSEALRGMAALSLQAGVIDKALEFYKRYLALNPNDLRVKTDYALALIEGESFSEADQVLTEVLASDPNMIAAHMTIAYRLKQQGDLSGAKQRALQAQALAKEERDRTGIQNFITALEQPEKTPAQPQTAEPHVDTTVEDVSRISPATRVDRFFREHPIVGPKVQSINWKSANRAQILVANFPVEQMPPFAKAQFIKKVSDSFADLPEPISIELVDSVTMKELIVIPVGKVGAQDLVQKGSEQ